MGQQSKGDSRPPPSLRCPLPPSMFAVLPTDTYRLHRHPFPSGSGSDHWPLLGSAHLSACCAGPDPALFRTPRGSYLTLRVAICFVHFVSKLAVRNGGVHSVVLVRLLPPFGRNCWSRIVLAPSIAGPRRLPLPPPLPPQAPYCYGGSHFLSASLPGLPIHSLLGLPSCLCVRVHVHRSCPHVNGLSFHGPGVSPIPFHIIFGHVTDLRLVA